MSNSSNFEESTISLISEMETGFSERKCTISKQLPWMEKEGVEHHGSGFLIKDY